jgi:hypothetical protein
MYRGLWLSSRAPVEDPRAGARTAKVKVVVRVLMVRVSPKVMPDVFNGCTAPRFAAAALSRIALLGTGWVVGMKVRVANRVPQQMTSVARGAGEGPAPTGPGTPSLDSSSPAKYSTAGSSMSDTRLAVVGAVLRGR